MDIELLRGLIAIQQDQLAAQGKVLEALNASCNKLNGLLGKAIIKREQEEKKKEEEARNARLAEKASSARYKGKAPWKAKKALKLKSLRNKRYYQRRKEKQALEKLEVVEDICGDSEQKNDEKSP